MSWIVRRARGLTLCVCVYTRPLPPLDTSSLPAPYITLPETRGAGPSKLRDPDVELVHKAASSIRAPAAPAPPAELTKDGKRLTKKEMKKVRPTSLPRSPNFDDP